MNFIHAVDCDYSVMESQTVIDHHSKLSDYITELESKLLISKTETLEITKLYESKCEEVNILKTKLENERPPFLIPMKPSVPVVQPKIEPKIAEQENARRFEQEQKENACRLADQENAQRIEQQRIDQENAQKQEQQRIANQQQHFEIRYGGQQIAHQESYSTPSSVHTVYPTKIFHSVYPVKTEFIFLEGKDSRGGDICHKPNKSIQDLCQLAVTMDNCVAFNTGGWMKHTIVDLSKFNNVPAVIGSEKHNGLYIKKSHYIQKFGIVSANGLPIVKVD